ncbi:FMN-binding glutamate synthase family protein [Bacillus sp. 1NLA3E]|uniref:FMN-binding glutamate synthase family protein n=1 Tax=Bacillus sp. 1NLA3E TaxID=666686 RepID=UPI000247F1B7|nr:FMN-binding glutamate synthase family protein [Bacillus sp. 1NLA3E]AGK54047.1 glutamate synthase [Bacillus sp. 1NLA3E]
MKILSSIVIIVLACVLVFVIGIIGYFIILYRKTNRIDKSQQQHAIRRNYPVLSRIRYFMEQIAPEIKQYILDEDHEGKPFSRLDFQQIVKLAKYGKNIISFGSKRDFDQPNQFYLRNAFFAKQLTDLDADNKEMIYTKKYIDAPTMNHNKLMEYQELFFPKNEKLIETEMNPWLYKDDDTIVIGEQTCRFPFVLKSPIGMSGMSYGALGENAIEALGLGLKDAKAFMNTGEGGISPYHLKSGVDIIAQIGPAKFGFRNADGSFSWEELQKKAQIPQIKAFEIKLGQGAKIRGGHLEGSKVTPQIAEIRGVEPWKTINSPNRFDEFHDFDTMFDFIEKIREVTGKPVGIKMVVGGQETFEEFVQYMAYHKRYPDYIAIDGGEGGTGATYQSMADSVGLPIKPALMIAQELLIGYQIRDQLKVFASGKLFSPDRIAIALAMGADVVVLARGLMISAGCISAGVCATGNCPVGVATTNPKLQKALVVGEKRYRVTNYVTTLREELFALSASAGLTSPKQFKPKHVVYVDSNFHAVNVVDLPKYELKDKRVLNS